MVDWAAIDLAEILSQTCDVQRFTSLGNDSWGNPVESWAVTATGSDVACLLEVMLIDERGREVVFDNKVTFADYRLYLDPTAVIAEKDRITDVDGGTEIYDVIYVEPLKDLDATVGHREVLLRIVR